jgi:hypothetical protein
MRLSAATTFMGILKVPRVMALNREYAAFSRCDFYGNSKSSKGYGA